mmetsp:Transcript_23910/g.33440  ORF Transcript_23910/g.33440 Transcript_23910/m.33440 type:complete len:305 (+) Transcript_23910:185-1099(+)
MDRKWNSNDHFAENYGRSSMTGGGGTGAGRGSGVSSGGRVRLRPSILRNSIRRSGESNGGGGGHDDSPAAAAVHRHSEIPQASVTLASHPTATAVPQQQIQQQQQQQQQDNFQGLGVGMGVNYEDAYAAQAATATSFRRQSSQQVSFEADDVARAMRIIDADGAATSSSPYNDGHEQAQQREHTPSMQRRSTLTLPPAPLPRESLARPPSPKHIEPAMPSPLFNKRFLKENHQRLPDLCIGKLLSDFRQQKHDIDDDDDANGEAQYITMKCHNCRNVLRVQKSSILVKCSVCKQVHPASTDGIP